jgi:hypothetical protein
MDLSNILLWKISIFRKGVARLIKRVIEEWKEKQEWRRYICGIYTDLDEEKHCPVCGFEKESEIVIVRKLMLRWLAKRGKVWTKHPVKWWSQ